MNYLDRIKELRSVRQARLAASALAVAAVVAGAVAGQANATPGLKAPKLSYGVLKVEGTKEGDTIALRLKAGQPGTLQVDVGDGSAVFSFNRSDVTKIDVNARGGDDTVRIDESNGVFTDTIPTTIDGGVGDDTLAGGSGAETLVGGPGKDSIDGNRGSDTALLGAGDDTFTWDPGDGSDTVEGQSGTDTMVFNGANVSEQITLSANGRRLRLFRNVANITMDTDGVEQVDVNALGGADTITANDLTATKVDEVNVDLGAADGQADQVIVDGTNRKNAVTVSGGNGAAGVTGLAATVNVTNAEAANDTLSVDTADGNDTIDASGLAASAIKLTVDSGAGNDTIAGGGGNDVLNAGDGNDSVDGNGGADVALLGAGDDSFTWDPGDGSDVVEGQDGADTMAFNGSAAAEQFDLSANGSRLRFTRNVGNIVMDTNGVEQVDLDALGGADTVVENDLTGTGVTEVNVDLGAGDGQPDHVVVNGTNAADRIVVNGAAGTASVTGLAAAVNVKNAEPANDTLTVNALAGADTVDASGLDASAIKLESNGGDDADVQLGSTGSDLVNGGRGNDTAFLEAGDDTFVWNPGDGSDTIEGQSGSDTDGVQRRQRLRAHRAVGERKPVQALPGRRQHHDGHERRRAGRPQHARRYRHRHRERPVRHQRHQGERRPGRSRWCRRRRGRQRDRQRHERRRRDLSRRGRRCGHRDRPRRDGERRRRRARQRHAHDPQPRRRRRGRGLGPRRERDQAGDRRRDGRRHPGRRLR